MVKMFDSEAWRRWRAFQNGRAWRNILRLVTITGNFGDLMGLGGSRLEFVMVCDTGKQPQCAIAGSRTSAKHH